METTTADPVPSTATSAPIGSTAPTAAASEKRNYTDILIAVHGIGSQQRNATVRSVATRLAESAPLFGAAGPGFAPQPLGYFHTDLQLAVKVNPLDDAAVLAGVLRQTGFAEVFWADIPQEVVKETRTLEETKAWARTVMARARYLCAEAKQADSSIIEPDFSLASEVLEEVIDTVHVLENLTWLAEKAGLVKFDLGSLLAEYLGDVQIVTEFSLFRWDIVGRFHRALEQIHAAYPEARLHIVAHSEGTVVSFLGLVHAMSGRRYIPAGSAEEAASPEPKSDSAARRKEGEPVAPWLKKVHGFMTIGSPIDKHLLLWPRLWKDVDLSRTRPQLRARQIKWRNYYDYGDPVGFTLNTARRWLDLQQDTIFEFCGCKTCRHDLGFARYLLPGKAHNDYWEDPAVFEHFINDVILPLPGGAGEKSAAPPAADTPSAAGAKPRAKEPVSRPFVKWFSPSVPFFLSAIILFIGTFILFKAVTNFLDPDLDPLQRYVDFMVTGPQTHDKTPRWHMLLDTLGVAGLIAGVTLAARLPQLALRMRKYGWLSFVLGCAAYVLLVSHATRGQIGGFTGVLARLTGQSDPHGYAAYHLETAVILLAALAVVLIAHRAIVPPSRTGKADPISRRHRILLKGARPLIFCGFLVIAAVVAAEMRASHKERHANLESAGAKAVAVSKPVDPNAPQGRKSDQPTAEQVAQNNAKLREELMVPRPVWPVLTAGAAFLYLWWLATLIFDLAFIWTRYVRGGLAVDRLHEWLIKTTKVAGAKIPRAEAHDRAFKPGEGPFDPACRYDRNP